MTKIKTAKSYLMDRMYVSEKGCWLWKLKLHTNGYACCTFLRQSTYAHILSYQTFIGEIPPKMEVMHDCDIRHCINPYHLTLGTHSDNMKDMALKNRGTCKLTLNDIQNIKLVGKAKILTQLELAKLYNISAPYVSRLCNDQRRIHI